ncbi:MAG TPA: bifunctional diguanylate cyclase/phosphodiesterase [Candidatus Dormibacteraeota bacterium]|nr:bifunctional diguanylate cyclase/phosphodiesterase [Candidatus Dormibacteraeota bacterium]
MNIDPQILEALAAGRLRAAEEAHDPVTGLPNRRQLQEQLAQAVVRARRLDETLAILIVDVDAFRIVNAAAGQATGDALLAVTAARLAACANGQLTARTGDNEFTILLSGVAPEDILETASAVQAAFSEPFDIAGRELHVTVSIGIADLARDGEGADFLLRAGAAALRRAKELGGNQRQHSSSALTLAEFERLHLEQRVRRAIADGELSLVYQPQVRLSDGALIGLEALLRWTRDGRTFPAGAFIRAIERSAVIIDVGEWVIAETCRQIVEWRRQGLTVPRIAINIGARHFQQPRLVDTIRKLLARHGVEGTALELEITETTAMHDAEATAHTIDTLRGLGLEITIDDFGTGYSSLAYLKRFAITCLKIDRAFVSDLPSRSATAIVNAIVATAHALDLRVVAEGVENEEQAAFLNASNCDQGQGYLFAAPMTAAHIPTYLQNAKEPTHAS